MIPMAAQIIAMTSWSRSMPRPSECLGRGMVSGTLYICGVVAVRGLLLVVLMSMVGSPSLSCSGDNQ